MPKAKIVLYTSKAYSNDTHPVMLRISHNRKSKYFSLNANCTKEQWDKERCRFTKGYKGHQHKNRLLLHLEERAYQILDWFVKEKKPFTFVAFEKRFTNKADRPVTVFEFFDELIADLLKKGKVGNAGIYKQAKHVLMKFSPTGKLLFPDIDYRYLKKLEAYLFERGCQAGGISVYLRTLRAVINEAIRQGVSSRESYPFATQFNRRGYSLAHLKSSATPRPLAIEDMDKIKAFPFDDYPHLARSVRYFLFSYYARGINFVDMAKLKWADIYNERINYTRTKTGKEYTIKLSENLQNILLHFKDINDTYVFPVLNEFHQTEVQIKNRVRKCLKYYNKDLKEIAQVLNIEVILTSYVARHTYATTLKQKGVAVTIISEGLGHADLATTKAYLEKFSSEVIDAADEVL